MVKEGDTELISLDEFINIMTKGKGESIKKELRDIDLRKNSKEREPFKNKLDR